MDRLRIAVIGLGWFGEIHCEAIIGMRRVLQWALIVASCSCAIWLLIVQLPC